MHRTALRRLLGGSLGAIALITSPLILAGSAQADPASRPKACTRPSDQPGDRPGDQPGGTSARYELESGDRTRSYILRLPKGYESRRDWPLIVAFHGRGSTGAEVEGFSKLSQLPAVVAYPNGVVGTGDGYRQAWQGAPYQPPGVDDVAFTRELLDHLQGSLCVDPARTYATGKSNGAGFVGLLACRLPDRLAAVAPVAGAFYPQAQVGCADARPVPVLDIHGTGDATIPYAGDPDRGLPAIRDWVADWADRDGCDPTPRERRTARDVLSYAWTGCTAEVRHVAVVGGGHVWPGSDVYSGGGYTTHSIEAHRIIWSFFSRHRLGTGGAR